MKRFLIFLFLFIISDKVHSKLSEEKRQNLLNKLTTKITLDNLDELKKMRLDFESPSFKDGIDYDPARIEKIMEEYDFPKEYNFLEDTNATIHVKDQMSCGCCWSHAATTALSYRYHKKNIEVDLSPQDGLSCYLRDCERGNNLLDPELNLVKNGTVTEGCLPFSSGDGITIEECPTSCKDGSPYKKYYAQNAYTTIDYYSEEYFYDIVILIMDQLTTNGPLVTGIRVYQDFEDLHEDPKKCHDEVYTYDGISEYIGGHAVVIVGYGFLNGKYYWLIQNSWGENSCDKGFVKVEFGQITVERVSFATPYLPNEEAIPVDINMSFYSINTLCDITIRTNSSITKWKNTLDINFQHSKGIKDFNYQCGVNLMIGGQYRLNCYYEHLNYYTYKGTYEFKTSHSLGTENNFILDDSFKGKTFKFWGFDAIEPFYEYYLISEEANRIVFKYQTSDESIMPPLYPNGNNKKPLSNCQRVELGGFDLIYCDITLDEIKSFDLNTYLVFDILCEYKQPISYVFPFDEKNFASFKIVQFKLPESKTIDASTELKIVVNINGNVIKYKNEYNSFISFVDVEKGDSNSTKLMLCFLEKYSEVVKQSKLDCYFIVGEEEIIEYDNLYLLQYYMPYESNYPFQIIINSTIKADDGPDPEPDPDPKHDPKPDPKPEPTPSLSRYSKLSTIAFIVTLLLMI
jgi:C1A family cysteine protease